jgi:hypothetical protein
MKSDHGKKNHPPLFDFMVHGVNRPEDVCIIYGHACFAVSTTVSVRQFKHETRESS